MQFSWVPANCVDLPLHLVSRRRQLYLAGERHLHEQLPDASKLHAQGLVTQPDHGFHRRLLYTMGPDLCPGAFLHDNITSALEADHSRSIHHPINHFMRESLPDPLEQHQEPGAGRSIRHLVLDCRSRRRQLDDSHSSGHGHRERRGYMYHRSPRRPCSLHNDDEDPHAAREPQ